MKILKKYNTLIIALILLFLIAAINYYTGVYTPFGKMDTSRISSYSFWFYTLNYGMGSTIAFLSQVIIPFVCVYYFFQIIHSGFIQNIITKITYKKYLKKEICNSYKKAILLFPLFSLIIFIIGSIFFTHTIGESGGNYIYIFPNVPNPLWHVILSIISISLYSLTITNIALILSRYFKKFYIVLIITVMVIFLISFIEGNLLSNILYGITKNDMFYNINIYDDFLCARGNYFVNIFFGILRNIITGIILYFTYHNKEKVVLSSD